MEPIIRTEGLYYKYRQKDDSPSILSGIDMEIEKGSFVTILGHNGSGKSTLAKHFNAILLPTMGTCYVLGMDTRDETLVLEIRRSVGMGFQNPDNQIVANIVEDDVAFALENLGIPSDEIRRRVDEALKLVGMYEYRMHAPHLLSGGQKQRVALAGAIAMRPGCLVLDEPTAMLDPSGRREVISTVKMLCKDYGITTVLITHHMSEVIDCDRVIVMADGKIVMDDTPKRIFTNVAELRALSLAVPETTELLWELNGAGMELPLDALSIEDCAQAVASRIR